MSVTNEVQKSYDIIASHFSETRKYPWPEMKAAATFLKEEMNVLDIGCGNGRFLEAVPKDLDIDYTGTDLSEQMIKCAKDRYPNHNFKQENLLDLDEINKYDLIVSFAMFHHLPNEVDRLNALEKISKALKKNGQFICTVWNLWSLKRKKYLFQALKSNLFNTKKSYKDCLIPWFDKDGNKKTNRYYYAFRISELKKLIKNSDLNLEEIFFTPKGSNILNGKNIYVRVSKPSNNVFT